MTIQISRKMPNDAIYLISGSDYTEFSSRLAEMYGEDVEAINDIEDAIRDAFRPPAISMAEAVGNVQAAFPGAQPIQGGPPWAGQQQYPQQQQMRPQAGPMPGGQQTPMCPNHGMPATWQNGGVSNRTGQPYPGFWKCATGDRNCKPR